MVNSEWRLQALLLHVFPFADSQQLDDASGSELSDDKELIGYESFAFSVEVKWPVSLVINSHDHSRYQMVFRHLFFIKYVERSLCQ